MMDYSRPKLEHGYGASSSLVGLEREQQKFYLMLAPFNQGADYQTRRLLLRCDSIGDLYPVTQQPSSTTTFALLSLSPTTWHRRLGHPSEDRSLYGLKQAPRAWFQQFASFITRVSFQHSALQYLTFTCPDISYAVQQIRLYMHDPRDPHFTALKHILRYVRGTIDHGLQLHVSSTSQLTAYTDADWAGLPSYRSAVYLSTNHVQHQRTKHIEIDISFATLDHFYPLAARLATRKQENPPSCVVYIDPGNCQGVKFIHATVDATVVDIVTSKDVHTLVHSFFDLNNAINHDGHTLPLLSIQVTELTDGIFIGGSVNHLLADGTSFWHFMATWSEMFRSKARDVTISRPPVFKKWVLEGSEPIINLPYTHAEQFIERSVHPQVRERFFHFSSDLVTKLKARANAECNTNKISSLQAVSAFIWKCVTRVRRQPNKSETICRLVVSNRSRVNPPLTENYVGSHIQSVSATTTVEELMAHGLGWVALKLHEVVKSHDDTSVKNSPRFDMYGCKFGLGKAVVARSGFLNKADGKMTMYPGREGGGSMDVEVCLLPEYMMELERDEEFICALESN
ncbi:uncharacterized acetyltransferase-like protein [Tanacetum coccineum]